MLIAGFEASLLHAYQSDRDQLDRFELAQSLCHELDQEQDIEEVMLGWLPNISSRYSVGIFRNDKLAYNYNYNYPVVLPKFTTPGQVNIGDDTRREAGFALGNTTVLVGKRNIGLMQIVSLFSYVFALFNIILFFLALSNSFLTLPPFRIGSFVFVATYAAQQDPGGNCLSDHFVLCDHRICNGVLPAQYFRGPRQKIF